MIELDSRRGLINNNNDDVDSDNSDDIDDDDDGGDKPLQRSNALTASSPW